MHLAAYHFDGDPDVLLKAHERSLEIHPPDPLLLHFCVVTDSGIVVYDACPSREVFDGFSDSEGFRAVLLAAGLPAPRLEPIGTVVSIAVGEAAVVA